MLHGLNDAARAELEDLREQAGGRLLPEAVVERARSQNSALHRYFEWNNDAAAHAYRLQQARQVIRAVVRMVPNGAGATPIRAYVSLPSDRATGNGYRAVADVLTDEAAAAEAMRELRRKVMSLRAKYGAWVQIRPALDEALAGLETAVALLDAPAPAA